MRDLLLIAGGALLLLLTFYLFTTGVFSFERIF